MSEDKVLLFMKAKILSIIDLMETRFFQMELGHDRMIIALISF